MVRMERLELSIFRLKVGSLTNLATFSQEGEEVAHLPPIKRTRQGTPILESGRNSVSIGVDAYSYLSPPTRYATCPARLCAGRPGVEPGQFLVRMYPTSGEGQDRSVFLICRQHIRHLVAITGFEPAMFLMWRILSALRVANFAISPSGILFSFLTLGTYLVYHQFDSMSSIFFFKISSNSSSSK